MKTEKKTLKLMEQVQIILKKRGQKAFEIAENSILHENIEHEPLRDALSYFMVESWYDVQHPALLSLACETVGGDPDATTHMGAAMVLLAGAADIHDDIIDKSKTKGSKPTVLGKFGKDIALLAGDALLFKGLILLHEACEKLPGKQRRAILSLTKQAFFELGSAEAQEISFKGKWQLDPSKYFNIIEKKAAIAETTARVGAILGGGNSMEIDALGHYGKTLGILMTIRDDFIDLFEPDELRNRAKNECLPLPVLYAFRDTGRRNEIVSLLEKNKITEQKAQRILDLAMESEEVGKLKKEMESLVRREVDSLGVFRKNLHILRLLLRSTLEDL